MENVLLLLSGLCVPYQWEMTFCVCVMSRNAWLTFTCISQTYAKEVTDVHYWNSKTKMWNAKAWCLMSSEKIRLVTVSDYYRAKCEQLEWHTLMIRHTTQTQDPAKLIRQTKFVNIHSKPCELCQVLEECSNLLLSWQAVQQDFRWRLTFMRKLCSKLPQKQ